MGLNDTPNANRCHIGFFGMRNAGKSSLVNAVTSQNLSVVSSVLGTTTDPVHKAMELLPLGPVVIFDTPGFDDCGSLGNMRIQKTKQVLHKTDIAVLVADAQKGLCGKDMELKALFEKMGISYIIAYNKADLLEKIPKCGENEIYVSAVSGYMINELKEKIAHLNPQADGEKKIAGDLTDEGDIAVLVIPIDSAAPKGRLILPQVQTIRDILDSGAQAFVVLPTNLTQALLNLKKKPKLVICDSQVFETTAKQTPEDIALTSFSILMARYKGFLESAVCGAGAIDKLKDGDTVLISEGCSHHRQCDDIGTVKLPGWIREYTKKKINFRFTSGTEFDEELKGISLVIHCGGCMISEREVKYRLSCAQEKNVAFTNYGIAIAHMKGILKRSIAVFPGLFEKYEKGLKERS